MFSVPASDSGGESSAQSIDLDTIEIVGHVVGVPSPTPDSDQQHCETNEGEVSDPVPTTAPTPFSPP